MTSARNTQLDCRIRGFTLLELVVVLVVLALAAALAAPALTRGATPRESGLEALILGAREAAARRGETIHLTVLASGGWTMVGAASTRDEPIQSGRVDPFPGLPVTLIVSPVGSCGFDARSAAADSVIRLDPLTCTVLD
jgi:prepilin-type N-terminal cleavage/methylation domain-containing protein